MDLTHARTMLAHLQKQERTFVHYPYEPETGCIDWICGRCGEEWTSRHGISAECVSCGSDDIRGSERN